MNFFLTITDTIISQNIDFSPESSCINLHYTISQPVWPSQVRTFFSERRFQISLVCVFFLMQEIEFYIDKNIASSKQTTCKLILFRIEKLFHISSVLILREWHSCENI
jgi:hypothetical protein